ncbi:antA/AntB antirepressor family protein [Pantoea stewartii]|uniref:antA/AntB antirepressor family protein n=1 Tax=Pantoea stewartii TaxID=66269 RepID=UPI003703C07C
MKIANSPLTGAGRSHAQNSHSHISSGEFADLIPVIPGQNSRLTDWIKRRIAEYGFIDGDDYQMVEILSTSSLSSAKSRQQVAHDYLLTLDTAKELAMVERNERGRAVRRYAGKQPHAPAAPPVFGRRTDNPQQLSDLCT